MKSFKKLSILSLGLILASCSGIQIQNFESIPDGIAIIKEHDVSNFVINNLEYNIKTDAFNRFDYIDIDGYVENHRTYPVKLMITIPIKDKNKKVIHKFKIEKYLKAKETVEISERFTAPHFVYGYLTKEDIKVQVIKDNDFNIDILIPSQEKRVENVNIKTNVDGVQTTTKTYFNNGSETKTNYEIKSTTTKTSSYIGY